MSRGSFHHAGSAYKNDKLGKQVRDEEDKEEDDKILGTKSNRLSSTMGGVIRGLNSTIHNIEDEVKDLAKQLKAQNKKVRSKA